MSVLHIFEKKNSSNSKIPNSETHLTLKSRVPEIPKYWIPELRTDLCHPFYSEPHFLLSSAPFYSVVYSMFLHLYNILCIELYYICITSFACASLVAWFNSLSQLYSNISYVCSSFVKLVKVWRKWQHLPLHQLLSNKLPLWHWWKTLNSFSPPFDIHDKGKTEHLQHIWLQNLPLTRCIYETKRQWK